MKGRWLCVLVMAVGMLIGVVYLCYGLIGGTWEVKLSHSSNPTTFLYRQRIMLDKAKRQYGEADYGRLPLYFIENRGQVDKQVKYYASGKGYTLFFTHDGMILSLVRPPKAQGDAVPGSRAFGQKDYLARPARPERTASDKASVVYVRPMEIQKNVKLKAIRPQKCVVNYFIGNDPSKWHTDIPTYAGVLYEGAYQGVDLKFYGRGRELEYDLVVKPGADPGQVRFAYEGVKEIRLTPEGHLALRLPDGGELLQKKPIVYQEIAGQRISRDARFVVKEKGARLSAGFEVASYDKKYPLVIDPVLVYSTYLGGSNYDEAYGIAVDATGAAYVAGYTSSTNFPTANALQGTFGGGSYNAFIAKISPGGNSLSFATYLGGSTDDRATAIAVDAAGAPYVAGYTSSSDFPISANALQRIKASGEDAFVTKLSPAGNSLVYSTYLGGNADDRANAIVVDSSGSAYVAGGTGSGNFPSTPNAPQRTLGGAWAAFVSKISPAGDSLVYSTYLGGSFLDSANGIAVDSTGAAYVTGQASSPNFPTSVNAWQKTFGGGYSDAFISKINPAGSALLYSTYLGGSGDDLGKGVAVDSAGAAYVTGFTSSSNFHVTGNAPQSSFGGGSYNAFVTKINAAGAGLVYSTYLGGSVQDMANGIALDATGAAYVTGATASTNFPTTINALQRTIGGARDAFMTKLSPDGDAFNYSTYLGGGSWDWSNCIAVDSAGGAYVAGYTSGKFPARSAVQYGYGGGGGDAFVAKIGDAPKRKGNIVPVVSLLLLLND